MTPTYRIEFGRTYRDGTIPTVHTACAWDVRRDGRPTDARLADYVETLEASTRPGGVNDHLGAVLISSARVVRQSTGAVVAEYAASAFSTVA